MVCINVVVGGRYPLIVRGVVSVLGAETDFNVAATCCNGAKCLEAIRNLSPDIALLDISMPGLGGLEILAAASSEGLSTRVVLLGTSAKDPELIVGVGRGAYGLILRDTTPAVLVQCLRQVASGQRVFPSVELRAAAIVAVQAFNVFTKDNDPYEDCASFELGGRRTTVLLGDRLLR